jgi:WD40 repeat protein
MGATTRLRLPLAIAAGLILLGGAFVADAPNLAATPDGRSAAALAAAADRFAHVTRVLGAGAGLPGAVVAADDGSLAFAAYEDGTVRSWDVRSGAQLGAGTHPGVPIERLAFDSAHRLLASADLAGRVLLWPVGPAGEIAPPVDANYTARSQVAGGEPVALDFYLGGQRLVAATADGKVQLWRLDWHAGAFFDVDAVGLLPDHPGTPVPDVGFAAASTVLPETAGHPARMLLAAEAGDVVSIDLPGASWPDAVIHATTTVRIPRRELPDRVVALAVRPGGDPDQAAVGTVDGVLVWDLRANRRIAWPAAGLRPGEYGRVFYTRDGAHLVVAAADAVDAVPVGRYAADAVVHAYPKGSATAAPAGTDAVVAVSPDGLVCLLAPGRDALVHREAAAVEVAFTPDGTLVTVDEARHLRNTGYEFYSLVATAGFVAAGGIRGSRAAVLIWPDRLLPFDSPDANGNPRAPVDLLHLPDRRMLVARNDGGEVRAWSTDTWREVFQAIPGYGYGLAYDAEAGRILAPVYLGGDVGPLTPAAPALEIRIDPAGGTLTGPGTPMPAAYRMAQRPGGGPIATLSAGNHLLLDGDELPLGGLGTALAFSPGGDRLAVATDDARVTVFDVAGRRALYSLPVSRRRPDTAYVDRLTWDAAGRRLAAATGTVRHHTFVPGEVTVVTADPDAWAAHLCRVVAPGLSAAQWQRYAAVPEGGVPCSA